MTVRSIPPNRTSIPAAWKQLPVDERRALLAKLLRERQVGETRNLVSSPVANTDASEVWPIISPRPEATFEPFPLTDIQYAYWIGRTGLVGFGHVGAHVYVEVEAPITDITRMSLTWQRLIQRHGMLRVTIAPDGQQRVLERVPEYWIASTDLRKVSDEDAQEVLLSNREQMSHRIYRPDQWPMFDVRAFIMGPALTVVFVSIDMLVVDLTSLQILLQEWTACFLNPDERLEPLKITFRDYVLAERDLRSSPLYARSKAYWSKRLSSLPPPPELPLAQLPGQLRRCRFTRRSTTLTAEVWAKFRQYANGQQLTPAAVLMTAFASTLARWTTHRRFVLNLTVFHRLPLHAQVNQLVGDFTSTSLLEFDLTGLEDFAARASRVTKQLWADLEHRYISGVQVLRDLAREQSARWSVSPVVFTSHLSQGGSTDTITPPAIPGDLRYGITQTPQVWLDHQVYERDGNLIMNWDAIEELFPAGLLDDMFQANVQLLRNLADDPECWHTLDDSYLPAQQARLGAVANATQAPVSDMLLHELFEQQAAVRAADPAVITSREIVTYGDLAMRARWVAHQLRSGGVRRGELVAVVMEKGWEQVVAVLGILQAGGAYLPIDPEAPVERFQYLLENAEARFVLTQSFLLDRLSWPAGLTRLSVDDAPSTLVPAVFTVDPIKPDDLAYVIYTSGTTGSPKGVMIDHRGAVNTILDINARFHVSAADRVLALSALTFDLSVYDVFGPLAVGGAIVMPDHAARRDPQHWMKLMQRERVTVWNSVPALLEMLVEGNPNDAVLPDLKLVMLSGDWIPLSLARHARETWPRTQLVSLGGATEASIWSILHVVDEVSQHWKSVPYGRPMVNQQVYVLDDRLNPCPDWVTGELFIGGVGLARGYWRDPEKTAERFFAHPRTGERLYRTGDLGRLTPDGSIELLGRVDRQVKIRGHRIELGEVEALLRRDPAVKEAMVVVRGEQHQARHLAAYVVPSDPNCIESAIGEAVSVQDLASSAELLRPFQSGDPECDASVALLERLEQRLNFKTLERGRRPRNGEARRRLVGEPPDALVRCRERRSQRRYSLRPVAFERFGAMLAVLRHDSAHQRRLYGSAGGLYPVQTYVSVKSGRIEGLPRGAYYYDPVSNELETLTEKAPRHRDAYAALINRPMYDEAAFALYLVVELAAIAPVYGDRSLHLATLEAGLMTQLLELAAVDLQIALCQIGDLRAESVQSDFLLGSTHRLIHSLLGGEPDPDSARAGLSATIADLRQDNQVTRAIERLAHLDDEQAAALLRATESP
jgi:amino acid adenylation domain-containing protein